MDRLLLGQKRPDCRGDNGFQEHWGLSLLPQASAIARGDLFLYTLSLSQEMHQEMHLRQEPLNRPSVHTRGNHASTECTLT